MWYKSIFTTAVLYSGFADRGTSSPWCFFSWAVLSCIPEGLQIHLLKWNPTFCVFHYWSINTLAFWLSHLSYFGKKNNLQCACSVCSLNRNEWVSTSSQCTPCSHSAPLGVFATRKSITHSHEYQHNGDNVQSALLSTCILLWVVFVVLLNSSLVVLLVWRTK